MSFTPGQRVTFTTPGRYPTKQAGEIVSLDTKFAEIKCDDGKTRKARPGTLAAA